MTRTSQTKPLDEQIGFVPPSKGELAQDINVCAKLIGKKNFWENVAVAQLKQNYTNTLLLEAAAQSLDLIAKCATMMPPPRPPGMLKHPDDNPDSTLI